MGCGSKRVGRYERTASIFTSLHSVTTSAIFLKKIRSRTLRVTENSENSVGKGLVYRYQRTKFWDAVTVYVLLSKTSGTAFRHKNTPDSDGTKQSPSDFDFLPSECLFLYGSYMFTFRLVYGSTKTNLTVLDEQYRKMIWPETWRVNCSALHRRNWIYRLRLSTERRPASRCRSGTWLGRHTLLRVPSSSSASYFNDPYHVILYFKFSLLDRLLLLRPSSMVSMETQQLTL